MQISSKKLSKNKKQQILDQFLTLIGDLQHPTKVEQFANDFFTDTELSVFAKRLAIAYSLHQGKSYKEIKQELKVSSATISSVAEIKNGIGTQLAIEKIGQDKQFQQTTDKIYKILRIEE
jgi:uncharacterized protein YerC